MTHLKRSLGLVSLTFYGIGLIIGAGIYSVIGAASGMAGEALWLSFVLGSVVALFTGLSYAELATMFPQAGAEYIYLSNALPRHRWASFAIGFILSAGGAASSATVALAFAGYLNLFVGVPISAGAMALLAACTVLNIVGVRESSWVNVVFTTIEVVGLLLVILLGVQVSTFGDALASPWHAGILPGAALVFFVYIGFEDLANLAEEARNPGRDLPRAILIGVAVSTTLYVLVALAVMALSTPEALASSSSPLATALANASPMLSRSLGVIGLFATANTVLILLIGASRMIFGMAEGGDLPSPLKRLLPGRQTPWVAALVLMVAATLFLPLGGVEIVASVSSLASLLAFTVVNVVLIAFRFILPGHERPFRVPLAIGRVPVPTVLGIVATVGLLLQFDVKVYVIAGAVLLLGVALYYLRRLL